MFELDFEWPLATHYVFEKAPPEAERAIRIAEDAKIMMRRPLDENSSLYAEFANLSGTEKAFLDFAHKYGTLFKPLRVRVMAHESPVLESSRTWKNCIKGMRDIIQRCELSQTNPAEAFRWFGKKDKRLFGVELSLSIKSANSPAALQVSTDTLISAMQLQAIQVILLEGRKSVQCIECSGPFQIGVGARRSHSKFCGRHCKDRYHNRLKAQAQSMGHA
jgi:hypothetical protein